MTRSVLILSIALIVAGLACFPEPLDETGKLCSVERPCGPDYECVANVCVRPGPDLHGDIEDAGTGDGGLMDGGEDPPDAGDPEDAGHEEPDAGEQKDLLVNGDFEEGDGGVLPGWRTEPFPDAVGLSMETQTPFGERAAMIYVDPPETQFSLSPSKVPLPDAGPGIYCATAWFNGEDSDLQLQIREGPEPTPRITRSSPVLGDGTWQELRVSRQTQTTGPITIRITGDLRVAYSPVYVDNVKLWRSASLKCEAP
ncbi:MAG: hypothetical protein WBV82_06480 [Myxococcaceae bacterium]